MAEQLRTSTRDLAELRERATAWLRAKVGASASVSEMSRPAENGLSSETLFFSATWDGRSTRCVARLAPAQEAVPVFPSYDLRTQFELMRLAREKKLGSQRRGPSGSSPTRRRWARRSWSWSGWTVRCRRT
ncbi:hypothetical protein [Nonomuraea salmonea]|uniref:hypothetical protein n=1 Tax=Nonomuraea salmonea TaxID=46181 RepID=UPI002FE90F92